MINPSPRNSKFKQGHYHPKNGHKLIGHDVPFYRSSLELKFMRWCDNNDKVLRWGSENVSVKYWDRLRKKQRTYFIDNYVEIREGNIIKKYLIEIKPKKQTIKPVLKKQNKSVFLHEQTSWCENCDKWDWARKFAANNDMEFLIITEQDLKNL